MWYDCDLILPHIQLFQILHIEYYVRYSCKLVLTQAHFPYVHTLGQHRWQISQRVLTEVHDAQVRVIVREYVIRSEFSQLTIFHLHGLKLSSRKHLIHDLLHHTIIDFLQILQRSQVSLLLFDFVSHHLIDCLSLSALDGVE